MEREVTMQQDPYQPYQPPTQYSNQPYHQPMQYPQYPPPSYQDQPKRKSKKWLWIALGAIAVAVFACIVTMSMASKGDSTPSTTQSGSSSQNSPSNDPSTSSQSARPATFTTTHTFSGSGTKKTEIFNVGDDWKLQWTCDPSSFMGGQYNVQVYVYGSDGSMQDVAINDICKDGNTSGETEEHSGGQIYLDVNSEGSWNLTIQEPK